MTRDHISRIPLDEQISMAGAGEDPQAVFAGDFVKKGWNSFQESDIIHPNKSYKGEPL